jgi:hypothetical protein
MLTVGGVNPAAMLTIAICRRAVLEKQAQDAIGAAAAAPVGQIRGDQFPADAGRFLGVLR